MSLRLPPVAARLLLGMGVCAAVLGGASALVEALEGAGVVETRTAEDWVRLPGQADMYWSDGTMVETRSPVMVPERFPRSGASEWRMFLLGESFAQGTPLTRRLEDGTWVQEGGIAVELQALLGARDQGVRVINAATGGMNSSGVRMVMEGVAGLEPDLVVVATCNNEGVLPPSALVQALDRLGGYRLLRKAVRPEVAPGERSWFTPQDPDLERVRAQFAENLRAMARRTAAEGVPMLLATLPVNLRYDGDEVFHHDARQGVRGEPQGLLPTVEPCVQEARALLAGGKEEGARQALSVLEACEDSPLALRWRGLALLALDQPEAARPLLEQSLELLPNNRCRPSFQEVIRQVEAEFDHVHLVDLQAAAEARAPAGLPGREQFVDYCHMHAAGYRGMASAVHDRMVELGLAP